MVFAGVAGAVVLFRVVPAPVARGADKGAKGVESLGVGKRSEWGGEVASEASEVGAARRTRGSCATGSVHEGSVQGEKEQVKVVRVSKQKE